MRRLGPLRDLVDLLVPASCVACTGVGLGPLCPACRQGAPVELVVRNVPAVDGATLPVVASTGYGDVVRDMIGGWKERGRLDATPSLAELLAPAVVAAVTCRGPERPGGQPTTLRLVPVPSRRAARSARGVDLGRELALATARRLRAAGWPARAEPHLLRHRRTVADQAGLGGVERERNLRGALVAGPAGRDAGPDRTSIPGALVLLDDVLTTGATLREAWRACRAAGHHVRAGAVLASVAAPGERRALTPFSCSPPGG